MLCKITLEGTFDLLLQEIFKNLGYFIYLSDCNKVFVVDQK